MPDELISEGDYKGHPTISLKRNPEDEYPLSFGIGKAKLIVKHMKAIEAFVAKHTKPV